MGLPPNNPVSVGNGPLLTTTPSFLSSRVIMGQRPAQGDEKSLRPATTLYRTVAPSFVIPSEAEGSAVPRTFPGKCFTRAKPLHPLQPSQGDEESARGSLARG
jgi:hypothetical protein